MTINQNSLLNRISNAGANGDLSVFQTLLLKILIGIKDELGKISNTLEMQ